jgi:hypothetical protein
MKYTTVIRNSVCFYCFLSESVFFIFILLGCWILPHYQSEHIVTEYLWVWLAGLVMLILYGIMFAIICRWFDINHGIHWCNQPHKGALNAESDGNKKVKAVANSMLLLVHFLFLFNN